MPTFDKKTLLRLFLGVFGCIVLYWLLHETERVKIYLCVISDIFAPFVFGAVLAFVLNVPMRAIENGMFRKVKKNAPKRILSILITFLMVLLVVSLVFWLLIPQIIDTFNSLIPALSDFFGNAQRELTTFLNDHPKMLDWLKKYTDFSTVSWSAVAERILSIFGNRMSSVFSSVVSAIGGLFSAVFNAVIGVVFCVYCLFQKETLARQGRKLLYAFIKEKTADSIIRILRLTNSAFSSFLSGQCVEVCILGSLFAVCMAIFRMPYIPLISVVIAISAFIPIVGAWVGCIVGAFLIFVESPPLAVIFVIMFLVLQLIENNMIYPRVVGTSVGLSGMWVLVAVAVGGELFGVVGMFLMIPAASVLYTLIREAVDKRLGASSVEACKLEPQPPEHAFKRNERCKEKKKKIIKDKKEK